MNLKLHSSSVQNRVFFNFFETKYGPFAKVIILFEDLLSFLGVFFSVLKQQWKE